jgi:hypothetical protein
MVAAAASACWVARPPCLTGNGGEDPFRAHHVAVGVGGQEALGVVRQALDARAHQTREADHRVGGDSVAGLEPQAFLAHAGGPRPGAQGDAALGQQPEERRPGHLAEDP